MSETVNLTIRMTPQQRKDIGIAAAIVEESLNSYVVQVAHEHAEALIRSFRGESDG